MFAIGAATQIFLATGVTDLRKGFNGLYAQIQQRWACDPLDGHLYVFCNRRRDALKIFFWSDTGTMWVCAARLERGTYRWPAAGETSVTMTASELHLLLSGIDLAGSRRRLRWREKAK
jgi:transposase